MQWVWAEIQGSLDNDPRIVNSKSKYSFALDEWQGGQPLKSGSKIEVIFPADDFTVYFSEMNANTVTIGQANCYTDYGFALSEQLICTATKSDRKVTIELT